MVPELRTHDHSVLATDIRLLGPDMKHLDARDGEEMMRIAQEFCPDMLMHLSAETDWKRTRPKWNMHLKRTS